MIKHLLGCRISSRLRWGLGLVCCLSMAIPAVGFELPELGEASGTVMSVGDERKLGEQIMREIRYSDASYVDDIDISDYLNSLGRDLVRHAGANPDDFSFFVIDDNGLNAFALPGGFVGVYTGLLSATVHEAELASVLSHEIAHVTQHHIARSAERSQKMGPTLLAGLLLGVLAARSNADVGSAAIAASAAASQSDQLKYSRDFEREADRIGLTTLVKSQYDPQAMSQFFSRLARPTAITGWRMPPYLSTHPLTSDRIADMDARIVMLPPIKPKPDSLGFRLSRAKIQATRDSPEQAIALFQSKLVTERDDIAARYGLAFAYWRGKYFNEAWAEIKQLDALSVQHPMLDHLAAMLLSSTGRQDDALTRLQLSVERYPDAEAPFVYWVTDLLLLHRHVEALALIDQRLTLSSKNSRLWLLKAKAHAGLSQSMAEHRALGEVYALRGFLVMAVDQFDLARRSTGSDFYLQSVIDARLREVKQAQIEHDKHK